MKKLIAIVFIYSVSTWSQEQHEPQNWKRLISTYSNIIFKQGQEKEAQKIANTINYVQKQNSKSIGYQYQTIDIILRANTVESNGFVTYSPFRSEFFNTAPQAYNNLGTTDWISTLAIHEYRHVQQFLNHKNGATNILSYLLGESGWAVGSILAVPNWYFEGDAVTTETALSKSGRGRIPNFTALQRSLYKQDKIYKYQKIRNGSYKDLVPNHYATGYQMLNYYRNHFDASKLDDIARKAASFSFPFYGFSYQMRKETGLGTTKLYYKSVEENKDLWEKQRTALEVLEYPNINVTTNKVSLYAFPQKMENGNIITLKTTLDKIPTFYSINPEGKETKITTSIYNIDPYFSYQQNQLVFTGINYNPRYNYSNYNNIYIYDIISKKRKQLTHQKRYFSPSFNQDNSKIIVTENNLNNPKIVVLNANNGTPISSLEVSGQVSRPQFIDEDNFVYLNQQNHQLAIFKINKKGEKTQLTPWTSHSIDNIRVHQKHVYYSASFNGIDNIYQTPMDGSLTVNQITNASIGAYQPFVKNNLVYFTEQTSNGNNISYTEITSTPFDFVEPIDMDWNNTKTVDFEKGNILDKISEKKYYISDYNSFKDIKFHDWSYSLDDEIISANITATNLLNDISLLSTLDIYPNENNSLGLGVLASYKKWFPILNLGLNFTNRDYNETLSDNNLSDGAISYNQFSVTPSITIPLSQVKGNYSNSMTLNLGYELNKTSEATFTLEDSDENIKLEGSELDYQLFKTGFFASSIRKKATQHINSHAGISTNANFSQTISGDLSGYFFNTTNYLFLPGLFKTHNSYVSFAYKYNSINNGVKYLNIYADTFSYARGFTVNPSKSAQKISLNYQLPILYPDFGLIGISYFKRIRANLFADFSKVYYEFTAQNGSNIIKYNTQQNSVGFEIIFDNTFFNISEAEIGIGYRGSYLLTDDIDVNSNSKYVNSIFISTVLF